MVVGHPDREERSIIGYEASEEKDRPALFWLSDGHTVLYASKLDLSKRLNASGEMPACLLEKKSK